ncbi:hypothetical protein [Shimia ponticola]|uniref:hypothetical protein n=1 Tax=Shimia ponticola TaxID=2582893 RepID=UPI0011BDD582|nr:hypothetical protein [Shimia ponticola]
MRPQSRIRYDRHVVLQYVAVLRWRVMWAAGTACFSAVVASFLFVVVVLSSRSANLFGFDDPVGVLGAFQLIDEVFDTGTSAWFMRVISSNTLLYLGPIVFLAVFLITAYFRFWRTWAEAQTFIAAAEVADNTSGAFVGIGGDQISAANLRWPLILAAALVATLVSGWSYWFYTNIYAPRGLEVSRILATDDPEIFVAELTHAPDKLASLKIFPSADSDDQAWYERPDPFHSAFFPGIRSCTGRYAVLHVIDPDRTDVYEGYSLNWRGRLTNDNTETKVAEVIVPFPEKSASLDTDARDAVQKIREAFFASSKPTVQIVGNNSGYTENLDEGSALVLRADRAKAVLDAFAVEPNDGWTLQLSVDDSAGYAVECSGAACIDMFQTAHVTVFDDTRPNIVGGIPSVVSSSGGVDFRDLKRGLDGEIYVPENIEGQLVFQNLRVEWIDLSVQLQETVSDVVVDPSDILAGARPEAFEDRLGGPVCGV